MSTLMLKIVACIAMLADHIGYFSYMGYPMLGDALRAIGRISFPIFAYLIAFGLKKTHNKYRYLFRLITVGLISEIPFHYCFSISHTNNGLWNELFSSVTFNNVYFTLALGLIAIMVCDMIYSRYHSSQISKELIWLIPFAAILPALLADLIDSDYGLYGVLLIVIFYFVSDKNIGIIIACTVFSCRYILFELVSSVIQYTPPTISAWDAMQVFALFSSVPIICCNGKKGIQSKTNRGKIALKYFFYLFYPIHLLIIGSIIRTIK